MSAAVKPKARLSRRDFLIVGGVAGVSLYLGVRFWALPELHLSMARSVEEGGGPPSVVEAEPMAWFEINIENRVRLYLPKAEMGQGIHTALAQIIAEELEIDWSQLEVLHASTGMGLDDPVATSNSNSVSSLYQILRAAGAAAREMLRLEAARQLDVSTADLTARGGWFFLNSDPAVQISYGQVVQHAGDWKIPEEAPALKTPPEFRLIGQSMPRVDLQSKITGKAVYGYDVRLPGMLYGAVAHPTTLEGRLTQANPGSAASMPGVVQVVIQDGFAGVVAESRLQAYAALAKMELTWEDGKPWQQDELDELVTVGQGGGVVIQREGDAPQALRSGARLEAEYRTPLTFHAHLEPLAAVADVQPESVQVWSPTQAAVRVRAAVAEALGRKEDEVVIHMTYLGGGFGRKVTEVAAVEAARLSAAVGKPVHVGWNRTEDFLNGFLRPPTHHKLRASLDDSGRLSAMQHEQASGEVAFPFLPGFLSVLFGADFGSWRGALIPYGGIPNRRTVAYLAKLPVATGWWRGLGLLANVFAVESFMDEAAHAAGADPLAFRLQHLPEGELGSRMRRVLEAAAERAGWVSPPAGRALGIACCYDAGTVLAEVAEVSVENNWIRVHKVTAAVDPGLVINPDGAAAQIQGAITMGVSSTLLEEVTVKDGALQARNFGAYRLLTMDQAPAIDVILLESSQQPSGLGEPPIGPVAAAVANAVFALTGQRLRRLPLRLQNPAA